MQTPDVPSGIQQILTHQMEAWANGDATAFAATFTSNATFVTVRGDFVIGRAGIEANHAYIFKGPYKGSELKETLDSVRILAPTITVAHVSVELSKVAAFPPGITPSGPGVLRTRFLLVFVEREGQWQIDSAQNTIVVPQPLRA